MGEVITFTSGKGGVGKTTTTANVGAGLSLLDKKVVLVDTDIGLRNLDVVMGLENRILYNLVDVLTGRCRVKQALIRDKRYLNLWIIPGIDGGFKLATADSDRIIVVTTPQIAAIHDADCVIQLLHRKKVPRIDLLVNGYRRQMVRDGNMLDIPDICELLEAELLGVVLEDEEIIISQNHGEPVIGKHTVSDTCYQNIARRIAGMEVAIPDYLHHKGMFSRFFWRNHAGKLV